MRFTARFSIPPLLLGAALAFAPALAGAQATATSVPAAADKPYQIADFIRRDRFQRVKISPKGTYVAATVPYNDRTVLVILKPGQTEPFGHVTLKEPNTHVLDFWWVSDNRILFTIGERGGALEQPVSYGEIWGTNADGSKQGIIAGARASRGTASSGRARAEGAQISIVDTLPDDDDNVLVSVVPFGAGEVPFTSLERMNVYTGTRQPVARAPAKGASFVTDQHGRVRFALGENAMYDSVLYYRKDDKSEWQLINDETKSKKRIAALDFNADDSIAYLQSEEPTGPDSILAFDVATQSMKQIARDDLVDPEGLIYAIGKRYPIGVMYGGGEPQFDYFDPNSADARLYNKLQSGFDGAFVFPGSFTDDGKYVLLTATDDRNPGDVYLFDTQAKKATLLMSRANWFDRERMAHMKTVVVTARDGRKLQAFLTIPAGSDGKHLPLVVNPHGGPFGPKDSWGYELEPQLLAAHGYAVLQVNFRGSGGYGKEFLEAGHKQWGQAMQDDLTDATKWAIAQGYADPARICLYGASYGGYASLMGVAKEPDLYKCAVGYVGVYDLKMLWGRGDISQSLHGKDFLGEALGNDHLEENSPNRLADRIKVPVFLAAGGQDKRAPQAHSEAMERALKAAGKSVETMYEPMEGHGFYKLETQREFYRRLLDFLHRNIGGREPVLDAAKK